MLQVEATCCAILLSATNFCFAARVTTEATTCLSTNLNSTLVIGCREARNAASKKTWRKVIKFPLYKDLEGYYSLLNTSFVPSKRAAKKTKGLEELS